MMKKISVEAYSIVELEYGDFFEHFNGWTFGDFRKDPETLHKWLGITTVLYCSVDGMVHCGLERFDNDIVFAVGAEYSELKPLHLRLGWNSFGDNYRADGSSIGLAGASVGLGIDYKSIQFSYAFSPAADLGESHRITVTGSP